VGRPSSSSGRRSTRESAQATVEFALVLPVLVLVMWLGVESVLLVRDQILVTHAAREAARVAAVGGSTAEASRAAALRSGLSGDPALVVNVVANGDVVAATVRLQERTRLPILGRLVPSLDVSSSVTMRLEIPG
jgi:TadE-like protein